MLRNFAPQLKNIHNSATTTAAFLLTGVLLQPAFAADEHYPQMQVLLKTQQTIAGEPLTYPQSGSAKVTAAIITIPPGKSTGWHKHKVPLVGYLVTGELEMEYANGKRVVLRQGEAIMEAMSVSHIGANTGSQPAQIFVAFMGADNIDFTETTEAPATPPTSADITAASDLVDLAAVDQRLKFDIRYATTNNFMEKPLYPIARALLQRPAAAALVRAHDRLRAAGYGLMIFDAYRPWQITRDMWDQHPKHRAYLSDPLKGSRHNRGCAVDVTLYDLNTGKEVPMPSGYDEFTERAHPDYTGGTAGQRQARDVLRSAMEAEGFKVYQNEWWHFDFQGWEAYPVLNMPL